jgi:small GTP-binding protein
MSTVTMLCGLLNVMKLSPLVWGSGCWLPDGLVKQRPMFSIRNRDFTMTEKVVLGQKFSDGKLNHLIVFMNRLPGQDVADFKVPLIGDANVGKTSILSRYTSETFNGGERPTVGVSTATMSLTVNNTKVELSVWDTAGQEKYRSLVPLYTRHAALMILVFDLSAASSFQGLDSWFQKVRVEMGVKCPIFVCANKIDLPAGVSRDAVREWATQNQCTPFFTSAATGDGVNELFQSAGAKVAEQANLVSGVNPADAEQNQACC